MPAHARQRARRCVRAVGDGLRRIRALLTMAALPAEPFKPASVSELHLFLSARAAEVTALDLSGEACRNGVTDAELDVVARCAQLTSLALGCYNEIQYE
mgnify:CR=1 FL=1